MTEVQEIDPNAREKRAKLAEILPLLTQAADKMEEHRADAMAIIELLTTWVNGQNIDQAATVARAEGLASWCLRHRKNSVWDAANALRMASYAIIKAKPLERVDGTIKFARKHAEDSISEANRHMDLIVLPPRRRKSWWEFWK